MSFFPPVRGPSGLDAELSREKIRDAEAKAAQHARDHPDDGGDHRNTGMIRRALRRLRVAMGRRS